MENNVDLQIGNAGQVRMSPFKELAGLVNNVCVNVFDTTKPDGILCKLIDVNF